MQNKIKKNIWEKFVIFSWKINLWTIFRLHRIFSSKWLAYFFVKRYFLFFILNRGGTLGDTNTKIVLFLTLYIKLCLCETKFHHNLYKKSCKIYIIIKFEIIYVHSGWLLWHFEAQKSVCKMKSSVKTNFLQQNIFSEFQILEVQSNDIGNIYDHFVCTWLYNFS